MHCYGNTWGSVNYWYILAEGSLQIDSRKCKLLITVFIIIIISLIIKIIMYNRWNYEYINGNVIFLSYCGNLPPESLN